MFWNKVSFPWNKGFFGAKEGLDGLSATGGGSGAILSGRSGAILSGAHALLPAHNPSHYSSSTSAAICSTEGRQVRVPWCFLALSHIARGALARGWAVRCGAHALQCGAHAP